MPSTTSLDQDMRKLRSSKYTDETANEVRDWIESTLGKPLAPGDLLAALKDGTVLCELANLASPGVKYKKSAMPFVQMENISHFLRACELPPINLAAHDRFLTVDLYEKKDPAQVLQCLNAFSRSANVVRPDVFPTTIGNRKGGVVTPSNVRSISNDTKYSQTTSPSPAGRAMSPPEGSVGSPPGSGQSGTTVSSWSKKTDQGMTAPAWSIHQYGYMGGASQGNQGISFGARRQLTSPSPQVPSLADKERQRKAKAAEEERLRKEQAVLEEERAKKDRESELAEREAEERRWEEETRKKREEERSLLEQQKRDWEEQERRLRAEEAKHQHEDQAVQSLPESSEHSANILTGQTLSQYHRDLARQAERASDASSLAERAKAGELEKQLAEARERERLYQAARDEQQHAPATNHVNQYTDSIQAHPDSEARNDDSNWTADEREDQRRRGHPAEVSSASPTRQIASPFARPLPTPTNHNGAGTVTPSSPVKPALLGEQSNDIPPRPDNPTPITASIRTEDQNTGPPTTIRSPFARPSHRTEVYSPTSPATGRTDAYLASNPAPTISGPRISASTEAGETALEQLSLQDQREASQQKTRAGAWASKSILEREMEKERERQKEWQANQDSLKDAPRDLTQGTGEGQSWDVNQYGYVHGDSQNRGSSTGSGINIGGRRQIIGPRPQP